MSKSLLRVAPAVPALVLAVLVPGAAMGGVRFDPLGDLPGGRTFSEATGVSADGRVVVGTSSSAGGAGPGEERREAFRWTAPIGMVGLGALPGRFDSFGLAVSADGTVVVGASSPFDSGDREAFRWMATTGMVGLGAPTGGSAGSLADGVSADGAIVVGRAVDGASGDEYQAYRYDIDWHRLSLAGSQLGAATAASADGSVIVGFSHFIGGSDVQPFRFAGGKIAGLGFLGACRDLRPFAISGDGSIVYGQACFDKLARWTAATGWTDLGVGLRPYATTPDGAVVVGSTTNGEAAMLHPEHGFVRVKQFLEARGANLTHWQLIRATGISADGRVLVGRGVNPLGFVEGWRAEITAPDLDGDGLLDDWETEGKGIDVNGDGTIDLDLFALGARPDRQDLFVEVDSMTGFEITDLTRFLVSDAFRKAPRPNPDGSEGITLWLVPDETDLPHRPVWTTTDNWPDEFDAFRAGFFGTRAEREHPNATHILAAKRLAFRYCIIADQADAGLLGVASAVGGSDLVAFFGSEFLRPADRNFEKAALIMHELGHTLGLHHGGLDPINGKANYPSVMNYPMTFATDWNYEFWCLDYARESLGVLDEADLDETRGIGTPGGRYQNVRMPYGVNIEVEGEVVRSIRYVRLDGSETDYGDPDGTGFQDGAYGVGIAQDLNYVADPEDSDLPTEPSPGEIQVSIDDWSSIVLAIRPGAGPGGGEAPQDELTDAGVAWMNANFPRPTCLADFDGSGDVDFDDILSVLTAWGPCKSRPCPLDLDRDEMIGVGDLMHVLDSWGPCEE